MRPEQALQDLAQIRQRLQLIDAKTSFRCFSIFVSAAFYLAAACAQGFLGVSIEQPSKFVGFWFVVSTLCGTGILAEVWWRSFSRNSRITIAWAKQLVVCTLPPLTVATLMTWAISPHPTMIGLLPGMWALFAGLSIAAAARLLPAICQLSAVWLVVGGIMAIRWNQWTLSNPTLSIILLMVVGQVLLAVCLFVGVRNLEKKQ